MVEDKKYPHDDTFPDNVNPTPENRKAHSDRVEKERKEQERDSKRMAKEEGDSSDPDAVAASRFVPENEPEPEANKRRGGRQNETVN